MPNQAKFVIGILLIWILNVQLLVIPINEYNSRKLESICKQLTHQYGISMSGDLSQCTIVGKKLVSRFDSNQKLDQLGIRLFTSQMKKTIDDPVITDFLERIMLELILEENDGKLKERLSEYKIDITLNQASYGSRFFTTLSYGINKITDSSQFSLTRDTLIYHAIWRNPDQSCFSVRFPTNYELILGKDKKELDNHLDQELKNFSCIDNSEKVIIRTSAMEIGKDFFTLKGNPLFIKDVNSNTYFELSGNDTASWIYDKKFPAESLSNLFYHGDPRAKSIQVNILHHKYGKETEKYKIPLFDLVCYFKEDFQTYVGFEKAKSTDISAVVLFSNKKSSYLNMLWLKTDSSNIFLNNSIIEAELFSYIPIDNIKNLFGEFHNSGKLYNVKF